MHARGRFQASRRLHVHAVLLDGGGVLVLPHRDLIAAALRQIRIEIDPAEVPRAHYRAARAMDLGRATEGYLHALLTALHIPADRAPEALSKLTELADRATSGKILWSEPTPGAKQAIETITRAGIQVVVVTNSDGHGAENLSDARICQPGPGNGATVTDVIDSTIVRSAKPDPRIFRIAVNRANAPPDAAVHIGDMLSTDIAGARASGIAPIHFDPYRTCRARDHRHVGSLGSLWRHIAPPLR